VSEHSSSRLPNADAILSIILPVLLTIGSGMVGCPIYNVCSAKKAGEAELAQADQDRQIAVAQAHARAESAHFEAEAEITRAQGVARPNEINGKTLQGNEAYLRYLWINGLEENRNAVIHVPTEGNSPILEASRLPRFPSAEPPSAQAIKSGP
jgi:regulator of protease activity HflC (stomatin/prohibitin superfamily)